MLRPLPEEPGGQKDGVMIFLYPVQRQILLRMATAASSRVGSGFRSMRPLAHSTIPGMQKPHCTAPAAPKA